MTGRREASDRPDRTFEHLLITNEFSDRVFELRDSDTKTVQGQTTSYPRTVIPHSDFVRRLIAISPKN